MWNWRAGWRGGGKFAQLKAISLMLHFRAIFCINLGIEAKMGSDRCKIEEGNQVEWNCNSSAKTWQKSFWFKSINYNHKKCLFKVTFSFFFIRAKLQNVVDQWTIPPCNEIDDEKSGLTMKEQHIRPHQFPFQISLLHSRRFVLIALIRRGALSMRWF